MHWELVNGTVFHLRHAPHFIYPRSMPRPRHRPLFRFVESITLIKGGTVCAHCLYFATERASYYSEGLAWTT